MERKFTWHWEHVVGCNRQQNCQEWVRTFTGQGCQTKKGTEDINCIEDPVSDD